MKEISEVLHHLQEEKSNEELYNELIFNLDNCSTNLVSVMFSSSIFNLYAVSTYIGAVS